MIRGIGHVVSFLTVLPSGGATLDGTARHVHMFPLAGILIGLLVGGMGLGVWPFFDPLLVGLFVTAALLLVTGMHHTDGLADFADGMMAKGSPEAKLGAMRDAATGSAGVAVTALYVAGMVAAASLAGGGLGLIGAVVAAEVLAKFAMVMVAGTGGPVPGSSCVPFAKYMRDRRRQAASTGITLAAVFLAGGYAGIAAMGVTAVVSMILVASSERSFGGITGDVLGAANEISRLASLVVLVSL